MEGSSGRGAQCAGFFQNSHHCLIFLPSDEDRILLTGSPSYAHPSHFKGKVVGPRILMDADRDVLTLELVRACAKKHMPLLDWCRGYQKINVAMDGTLYQQMHDSPCLTDHR